MPTINSKKLSSYAHLVAVLRSLELEMGLKSLTPLERSIIATLSLDEFKNGARTEAMLSHAMLDAPTSSSFYRALKRLRQNNYVEIVGDRKNGIYKMSNTAH